MHPYDPSKPLFLQSNQGKNTWNPVNTGRPFHTLANAQEALRLACTDGKPDRLPRLVQLGPNAVPHPVRLPELTPAT